MNNFVLESFKENALLSFVRAFYANSGIFLKIGS